MAYTPSTEADRAKMLEAIGASDISELFRDIPESLALDGLLSVPGPMSEMELFEHCRALSLANNDLTTCPSFLGAGVYDHYIPATVAAVTRRAEFYTSYTPYQPEISQGNLQATFEFQTLICQLTGMDVANASMYDGATATAEAAVMASNITGRKQWVVSECVHPAYRETIRTYAWASGKEVVEVARAGVSSDATDFEQQITEATACVIVQHPNFFGTLESVSRIEALAHDVGALVVICFDPISLGLLKPPGELNTDICIAEGQALGIPPSFGGPLLGIFACKREFVRQMPGRLVGATRDTKGRRGYCLTLQTREQHIRRDKATSNICTNQALCALAATVYLCTLGKSGLREVAGLCLERAHHAAELISGVEGYEVLNSRFFKEFVVKTPKPVEEVNSALLEHSLIGGIDLGRFYPGLAEHMLLCVTERRTPSDIERLVEALPR